MAQTSQKYKCICVKSWNCSYLVTWFCYQLIAKPGTKTAAVLLPDLYCIGANQWTTVISWSTHDMKKGYKTGMKVDYDNKTFCREVPPGKFWNKKTFGMFGAFQWIWSIIKMVIGDQKEKGNQLKNWKLSCLINQFLGHEDQLNHKIIWGLSFIVASCS